MWRNVLYYSNHAKVLSRFLVTYENLGLKNYYSDDSHSNFLAVATVDLVVRNTKPQTRLI